MKALVTGSAGFIGRHMVKELEAQGWQVYTCDPVTPSGGDALELFRGAYEIFDTFDTVYDLVIHCAYHVGGRAAIDGTNTNFAKNLQLDSAMFEWAVRTRQKHVLYFSSSAAYPVVYQTEGCRPRYCFCPDYGPPFHRPKPLREDWIDLDEPERPDSNYGWAKLTGERLAADARRNGLKVSVVRPFSGYGEDQSRDYPFPSIVDRAKKGDLSVWGPKGQTRDWIHVSDVVAGALAVVESGTDDPVNLCTGRGVEMGDLAVYINDVAKWGSEDRSLPIEGTNNGDLYEATYDESKPTGVFYRVGDPTRMLKYYTPKVSLEEGIRRALEA